MHCGISVGIYGFMDDNGVEEPISPSTSRRATQEPDAENEAISEKHGG